MKRRALAMLMAIIMIISLIPVTASAAECTHSGQTPYSVTDPDNPKYHNIYCSSCGKQYDYAAHHYHGGACSCGATDPNCKHENTTTSGHVTRCSGCGKQLKTSECQFSNNAQNCSICGAANPNYQAPVHQHTEGSWQQNDSSHWKTCTDCGETVTSAAHDGTASCSVCDWSCGHATTRYEEDSNYHWTVCNTCGATVGSQTAHAYTNGVCACGYLHCDHGSKTQVNDAAQHWYTCDNCSQIVGSKEDHAFVNGACVCGKICPHTSKSYTNAGDHDNVTCDVCGKTSIANHVLAYSNNEGDTHDAVCSNCGEKIEDQVPHWFDRGVCVCGKPQVEGCEHVNNVYCRTTGNGHEIVCYDCGMPIDWEEHAYGFANIWNGNADKHAVYCGGCGDFYDLAEHTFVDGICEDCGFGCNHSFGMTYNADEITDTQHTPICAHCGVVFTAEDHNFSTGVCDCGKPCPHTETEGIRLSGNLHTHDEKCLTCNAVLEDIPHTPGTKYDTYDTTQHGVMCAKCGDFFMMEKHNFLDGDCEQCGEPCTNCKEGVKNPKVVSGNEAGKCVDRCKTCNKVLEVRDAHDFVVMNGKVTCEDCKYECEHAVDVAVFTGNNSYHKLVCALCEYDRSPVDKPHDFNNDEHKCSCGLICGSDTKPHNFDQVDCKENADGTHYRECRDCGVAVNCEMGNPKSMAPANNDKHIRYCYGCETDVEFAHTPVVGNDKGDVWHQMDCSECGQRIPNASHTWSNGECSDCGYTCKHPEDRRNDYTHTETGHSQTCKICGDLVVDKDAHDWTGRTGKCVDCEFECAHDGDVYYEIISGAKHKKRCKICDGNLGEETHDVTSGKCVCDQECLHLTDDGFEKTATGHTKQCTTCGELLEDKETAHNFDGGKCTVCQYTCEHDKHETYYQVDGDKHNIRCENCKVKLKTEAHDYTGDSICICEDKCTHPEAKYKWAYDADSHSITCDVCKQSVLEDTAHNFVNGKCTADPSKGITYACGWMCNHPAESQEAVPFSYSDEWCHQMICRACDDQVVSGTYYHNFRNETGTCVCGVVCGTDAHLHVFDGCESIEAGHRLTCKHCGGTKMASTKYINQHWETGHTLECEACNKPIVEKEAHNMVNETSTCVCGKICAHTKVFNTEKTSWTCSVCQKTEDHTHDFQNANRQCECSLYCPHEHKTYNASKTGWTCDDCGVAGTHSSHSYTTYVQHTAGYHKKQCVCGEISSDSWAHYYGGDKTCDHCGYTKS